MQSQYQMPFEKVNRKHKYRKREECVEPVVPYVENNLGDGSTYKLTNGYILWSHAIADQNWDIESYKKLCIIENASDYWKLANNFSKLSYKTYHYFFMKDDTLPIWEHHNNRNGGVCSFRVETVKSFSLWELLSSMMIYGNLTSVPDDINGISFCSKNNWTIIKIWNKHSKNDVSEQLNKLVIERFPHISVKYKPNTPEY